MLVLQQAASSHVPSFIPLLQRPLGEATVLGRDSSCVHVLLNDRQQRNTVSRLHASIRRLPSAYVLSSSGANGVTVNGRKVHTAELSDGDVVVFAPESDRPAELVYKFHADLASAFPAPQPQPQRSQARGAAQNRGRGSEHCRQQPPHPQRSVATPPAGGAASPPSSSQERALMYDARIDEGCPPAVSVFQQRDNPALAPSPPAASDEPPLPLPSSAFPSAADVSWNERWQSALDLPESDEASALHKYAALSTLSSDFLSLARCIGRLLISEFFLDADQQTLRPSGLGGCAGGRKYLVRGLLFKLCNDVRLADGRWLYGGAECDVESANAVGGHELRSAIRLFPFHSSGLRLPMMALVEWCGFTVLAMPRLPIGLQAPPVLGSNDGGRTVHADDPRLNAIVAAAAKELHLAQHTVGQHALYTAGDVEGHVGVDGRYYILDLARCSPPESPATAVGAPGPPESALYRLLRPELLQLLKADGAPPLSCDAFTQWGAADAETHNGRVTDATRLLHSRYLPALAEKLVTGCRSIADRRLADDEDEELASTAPSSSLSQYGATFEPELELQAVGVDVRFLRLSEEMHSHGCSVRHLGALRHHILTRFPHSVRVDEVALLLLVEAVSRALKGLLRQRLRRCVERVRQLSQCADYDAVRATVDFLNLCTAQHSAAAAFWTAEVVTAVRARFGASCIIEEEAAALFAQVSPHLPRVISYLCRTCGLALSPACEASLSSAAVQHEFTAVDVELRVEVRSMTIADYAEARVLLAEAALRPSASSLRLVELAAQIFDRLRHADPFNARYKSEARACRQQLARLREQHQWRPSQSHLSLAREVPAALSLPSHASPSLSALRPPTLTSSSALLRTGLSTGFARFSVSETALSAAPLPPRSASLATNGVFLALPLSTSRATLCRQHNRSRPPTSKEETKQLTSSLLTPPVPASRRQARDVMRGKGSRGLLRVLRGSQREAVVVSARGSARMPRASPPVRRSALYPAANVCDECDRGCGSKEFV